MYAQASLYCDPPVYTYHVAGVTGKKKKKFFFWIMTLSRQFKIQDIDFFFFLRQWDLNSGPIP
jgi:hypothetical protein